MQTLEPQCSMTKEELIKFNEAMKQWALAEIERYKDDPRKELIWELLTSRGPDRKIYGDCP